MLDKYELDIHWVRTSSVWERKGGCSAVSFMSKEEKTVNGASDDGSSETMRLEVAAAMKRRSFNTVICVASRSKTEFQRQNERRNPSRVLLGHTIGRLARTERLNDSVVNLVLLQLASEHDGVEVVDSLTYGKIYLPKARLRESRMVVFPINYDQDHWCIICVNLLMGPRGTAYLYDPMVCRSGHRRLRKTWAEWCNPFLVAWYKRDVNLMGSDGNAQDEDNAICENVKMPELDIDLVSQPKQRDGSSCGVLCILQAWCCMNDDYTDTKSTPTPFQIQTIRLRLLWLLMVKCVHSTDVSEVDMANSTSIKFSEYVKPPTQQPKLTKRPTTKKN